MNEITYKHCPKCDSIMKVRENEMTSSEPPLHIYNCPVCGYMDFDRFLYPYPKDQNLQNDIPIDEALYEKGYNQAIKDLDNFDWQSFRANAVKDILCASITGGIARGADGFVSQKATLVMGAIEVADELIRQLREDEK